MLLVYAHTRDIRKALHCFLVYLQPENEEFFNSTSSYLRHLLGTDSLLASLFSSLVLTKPLAAAN